MSFSLDAYLRNRSFVIGQLDQMSLLYEEMNLSEENERVQDWKQQLLEDSFQIAVVGEFSRGKSTFINALLGRRLLPSSVKPTTTILNMISYNAAPEIWLHYRDAAQAAHPLSEDAFAKLVAPMEPIRGDRAGEQEYERQVNVIKSIHHAEIGYPVPFLQGGVRIIDTPGTNDLDPAREQITNNIIPQSDAAVLLLSATKILSDSEMSFLRDRLLANDIQKVFVVVNFKDLLTTEEDIRKVMTYAYDNLKPILGEPRLFLVAAKQALNAKRDAAGETLMTKRGPVEIWKMDATGFPAFEESLAHFLQHERGAIKLQRPIQRAMKSLQETITSRIAFERRSLNVTLKDIKAKVEAFRPKLKSAKQSAQDLLRTMDMEAGRREAELAGWYEGQLQQIAAAGLQHFDANRHLSESEISRRVEDGIAPLERELHTKKRDKVQEHWAVITQNVSKELNLRLEKLQDELHHMAGGDHNGGEAGHTSVSLQGKSDGLGIFDEILDELSDAWDNKTNSVIGKVAVGVGFVLTVAIGGLAHIIKAGWSWLMGDDPKVALRQQLADQFAATRREKVSQLRKEWKASEKLVKDQYTLIIDRHVAQLEGQLCTLEAHAGLEEAEVRKKLEITSRREAQLKKIQSELEAQYNRLQGHQGLQDHTKEPVIQS